ncbi:DoxX family protein [Roseovarius aquimarinus]
MPPLSARRLTHGAVDAIRILLAAVFLFAGAAKLIGLPLVAAPDHLTPMNDWIPRAVGAAQVVGGFLLGVPRMSVIGAMLLMLAMSGVAAMQALTGSGTVLPILGMVYLCAVMMIER